MDKIKKSRARIFMIRTAASDVKTRIEDKLKNSDKIELATIPANKYTEDFIGLYKELSEIGNTVCKTLCIKNEYFDKDASYYIRILEDNRHELYFASVNVDSKYNKNKFILENILSWLNRLTDIADKLLELLDIRTEKKELTVLFSKIDSYSNLSEEEKEELKGEFILTLNRLNKH